MTVEQLIAVLSEMPMDREVVVGSFKKRHVVDVKKRPSVVVLKLEDRYVITRKS